MCLADGAGTELELANSCSGQCVLGAPDGAEGQRQPGLGKMAARAGPYLPCDLFSLVGSPARREWGGLSFSRTQKGGEAPRCGTAVPSSGLAGITGGQGWCQSSGNSWGSGCHKNKHQQMAAQVGMMTDTVLYSFICIWLNILPRVKNSCFSACFHSSLTSCPKGHFLELKVPQPVADLL